MNCDDFQQQLQQAVESHGPTANEAAAFAHHLESCQSEDCRQLWSQTKLLSRAIRQWHSAVPAVNLTDRVVAELRTPPVQNTGPNNRGLLNATYGLVREPLPRGTSASRRTSDSTSLWMTLGTLAAAMLLMLSLLTLNRPAQTDVAVHGDLPQQQAIATDDLSKSDDASVAAEEHPPSIGGTCASMPLSATQFLTDAVVLVVPADLSDPQEEPSRADVWADRLGKQWEPIGRELSSAFETLLEVVPKSPSAS